MPRRSIVTELQVSREEAAAAVVRGGIPGRVAGKAPQPAYKEQYTVIIITLGVLQNWRVSQDRKRKCQRGSACRVGRSPEGPRPRWAITATHSNSWHSLVYSKYSNFPGRAGEQVKNVACSCEDLGFLSGFLL